MSDRVRSTHVSCLKSSAGVSLLFSSGGILNLKGPGG